MKVSVYRKSSFNSAHRLHNTDLTNEENQKIFGLCNRPNYHGHNYDLIVKLTGEINSVTGYVIDLKVVKDIVDKEIIERFDHRNLNLDCIEFKALNPTAENISVVIWNLLRPNFPSDLELSITLYETERNFVEYNGN